MKLQKGFSMVGLMAVVAIIAIVAVVSLPVYNQYIEQTKVSKEIPVIGTYKNDIASCFMKDDSLEDCNDGESGIHPGLDNEGKILSLDVFKGNIVIIIDAQNHMENVEPVELMYVVNPNVDATFPTLDWTLYCNDYSSDNNALVKECDGLITDKDGDGYDDSIEEEWGSDPLDPESVPVNWEPIAPIYSGWTNDGGRAYTSDWEPEVSSQTSDFTQTRSYTQTQTRERTDREQDSFSGNTRVVDVIIEDQTISGSESRVITVSSGNWTNTGSPYNCDAWAPSLSGQTSDFTQTRGCSIEQEKTYNYSVGGSFTDTQVSTTTQSRTVDVSGNLSGGNDNLSSWSTYSTLCGVWGPDTSTVNDGQNFTQNRSCTDYQERFKYYLVNGQVVGSDRETRTTSRTESRSATGTKPINVIECLGGGWGSNTIHPPFSSGASYAYTVWFKGDILGNINYLPTQSNPVTFNGKNFWAGNKISNFRGGEYAVCHYK